MLRALSLILVLALTACSKTSSPAAGTATPAGQPADTASGAAAPKEPDAKPVAAQLPEVVAKVNGESIAKAEFEKAVQAVESQNGGPVPPDQRDRVLRGVLDQLIGYKLLIQESKSRKLAASDADVDARLSQIKAQFPSEEAFKQTMDQQKITLDQLKTDARTEIVVTRLVQEEIGPKVSVKSEQVDDFYKKNPDKFQQPESVRASHILIRVPEGADAAAKAKAKTKAEGILKDVKAGKDFATLAKANSEDPGSAPNGGDLNFFPRGQMVPAFDQAAFAMKSGEVSNLVETQFGFHIIKVTDKQPAKTVPLDQVRPQIQQYLEGQARQEQTQAFLASLKSKGKVEIFI